MLTTRGLGTVLRDLAEMGYDAEWGVLGAADVGANHQRDRIWIVAKQRDILSYTEHNRVGWGKQQSESTQETNGINTNTRCQHGKSRHTKNMVANQTKWTACTISIKPIFARLNENNWKTEPNLVRMVNGVADGVDRLKAIGNGQVPLCAATAWTILMERINES